jgi:hypothetical protein
MSRSISLACIEDSELELQVQEQESDEGTAGVLVAVGDIDEGVLLLDDNVKRLIEWLEEWRVRQAGSKGRKDS